MIYVALILVLWILIVTILYCNTKIKWASIAIGFYKGSTATRSAYSSLCLVCLTCCIILNIILSLMHQTSFSIIVVMVSNSHQQNPLQINNSFKTGYPNTVEITVNRMMFFKHIVILTIVDFFLLMHIYLSCISVNL